MSKDHSQQALISALEAEIFRLHEHNSRLRELLRPFAALPVQELGQCQRHPDTAVFAINGIAFTATDVLKAREALGGRDD